MIGWWVLFVISFAIVFIILFDFISGNYQDILESANDYLVYPKESGFHAFITILCFILCLLVLALFIYLLIILIKNTKKEIEEQKKEKQRLENLTPAEKYSEYLAKRNANIEHEIEELYKVPTHCPSCGSKNYKHSEEDRWNGHLNYLDIVPTWILESSISYKDKKFDSAFTLGGATTIFTKEQTKKLNTYRCPNCNYKLTK